MVRNAVTDRSADEEVDQKSSGFILIVAATGIVGIAGYVITWLVPAVIGVAPYAVFAVFWSFIFLVAAALSGIQQEVTRATHARDTDNTGYRNRA